MHLHVQRVLTVCGVSGLVHAGGAADVLHHHLRDRYLNLRVHAMFVSRRPSLFNNNNDSISMQGWVQVGGGPRTACSNRRGACSHPRAAMPLQATIILFPIRTLESAVLLLEMSAHKVTESTPLPLLAGVLVFRQSDVLQLHETMCGHTVVL